MCVRAGSGGCGEREENCIPLLPALDVPKTQHNKYIFALCFSDSQYEVKGRTIATLSDPTTWLSGPELRRGQTRFRVISLAVLTFAMPDDIETDNIAKTVYFAYGSNLWIDQMNRRCPENKYVGVGVLHDW